MRAEILTDPSMCARGSRMLQAMIAAAPIPVTVGTVYRGDSDLLMTYGMGHLVRRKWWMEHLRKGGHCIGWDLGYWGREQGAMRVSIDHDHPQAWLRSEAAERWDSQGIQLRHDARKGPVLVVGLGLKSSKALGLRHGDWERQTIQKLRQEGHAVLFRPKKERDAIGGVKTSTGPIEKALQGVSLVVCRHSNVAVDACIAGVPVRCEDGAALALYQSNQSPAEHERLQFLRSLAWWNWRPDEAREAWKYLLGRLS